MVTSSAEPVRRASPYDADCPTRHILDRIGDRWTVLVVGVLSDGDARFSQLARRVEGVSQKMLTQTLRGLERDGLVRRTVHPEVPVRVEYALTEAGRTLCEPLRALQEWAITHLGDAAAPARPDARTDVRRRRGPGRGRSSSPEAAGRVLEHRDGIREQVVGHPRRRARDRDRQARERPGHGDRDAPDADLLLALVDGVARARAPGQPASSASASVMVCGVCRGRPVRTSRARTSASGARSRGGPCRRRCSAGRTRRPTSVNIRIECRARRLGDVGDLVAVRVTARLAVSPMVCTSSAQVRCGGLR